MSEHTPGPWRISGSLQCWGETRYLVVSDERDITSSLEGGIRGKANARLIAAAPDLLAACEAALEESLLAMRDGSGRKSCHHCAHIEEHAPDCIFAGLAIAITKAKEG